MVNMMLVVLSFAVSLFGGAVAGVTGGGKAWAGAALFLIGGVIALAANAQPLTGVWFTFAVILAFAASLRWKGAQDMAAADSVQLQLTAAGYQCVRVSREGAADLAQSYPDKRCVVVNANEFNNEKMAAILRSSPEIIGLIG